MSEPMTRPGVGTGVYIRKDGKILMGMRRNTHGEGTWCAPGGKVELYEEWHDHCKREVLEEAGIEITNIRLMTATNDITAEWGTHYITLHFVADWVSGEPRDEEGKMIEWQWFEWHRLPQPLFPPSQHFADHGINPLEF
jgi:8-oxo-dGTP diphosphatase